HRAVLNDPAFVPADDSPFTVHTRWIETEYDNRIPPYEGIAGPAAEPPATERITVQVGGRRVEVVLPTALTAVASGAPQVGEAVLAGAVAARGRRRGGPGAARPSGDALVSPMQGTIVKLVVADGATVAAGDTIVVLEAMKMEQPLTAHKAGTVTGLSAGVGDTVAGGATVCEIRD
ncbi:biotin/lipoyl-containing protein, partial [Actinomadura atramentaria]|uniref:biotin/lipoyl-containing protein n=1 Tax=Actinomadura atramentaria TaxID=1990 RepID=UPI000525A870